MHRRNDHASPQPEPGPGMNPNLAGSAKAGDLSVCFESISTTELTVSTENSEPESLPLLRNKGEIVFFAPLA